MAAELIAAAAAVCASQRAPGVLRRYRSAAPDLAYVGTHEGDLVWACPSRAWQGCHQAFRKAMCGSMSEQRLIPAGPFLAWHHCTDGQHGLTAIFSLHRHRLMLVCICCCSQLDCN